MKKLFAFFLILSVTYYSNAQSISQKIQTAYQQFEADSQLKHATSSLYVIDAANGQVVFDRNSQVGLAPASTQKIITSVTAFELLGKEYRYKTPFLWGMNRVIYVKGIGDPTLGSWRYTNTTDTFIGNQLAASIIQQKKGKIIGIGIIENEAKKNIPSGWILKTLATIMALQP